MLKKHYKIIIKRGTDSTFLRRFRLLCAYVHDVCDVHDIVCVWKSEDNYVGSVLSSYLYIGFRE